jgi:hypothetical protein
MPLIFLQLVFYIWVRLRGSQENKKSPYLDKARLSKPSFLVYHFWSGVAGLVFCMARERGALLGRMWRKKVGLGIFTLGKVPTTSRGRSLESDEGDIDAAEFL